jgi:hypothetical protein
MADDPFDTFPLQLAFQAMLMEIDVKGIPCTGLKARLDSLLQQWPSLFPKVAVTRLRKMLELMAKTQEQHWRNACISDTTEDQQQAAATTFAQTSRNSQDFKSVGQEVTNVLNNNQDFQVGLYCILASTAGWDLNCILASTAGWDRKSEDARWD